jgi:type IX secretion system PorP/SprF family membrane protein
MKKFILPLLFLMCANVALAQQLPQYSQYFLNEYAINPAVAGKDNFFEARTSQRHQWIGITDAPRTYTLSVYGPLARQTMGVGAYVFTDIVGPTRRTGFQASYAYHLKFTDDIRLSLSASLGILNYAMDGSKIDLREDNDPSLGNSYQNNTLPDAKFAMYLYTKKLYVGLTVPQLILNQLDLYQENSIENRLVPHIMGLVGYKIQISDDLMLEPSVLVKYVNPAPLKMDITLRAYYQEKVWIGLNYRTNESFTPVFGYTYKDFITFAYGYDVLTNNLKNYASGSHEIMLGIRFSRGSKQVPKAGLE